MITQPKVSFSTSVVGHDPMPEYSFAQPTGHESQASAGHEPDHAARRSPYADDLATARVALDMYPVKQFLTEEELLPILGDTTG